MDEIVYGLVFIIVVIIGLVVGVSSLIRWVLHRRNPSRQEDKHIKVFLSKEDAISQFYFLLAVAFLGVTLFVANWKLNELITGKTILLISSSIGLVLGYYYRLILLKVFSTVALVVWWPVQATQWAEDFNVNGVVVFSGLGLISLLLYCLGRFQEPKEKLKRFATVDTVLGLFLSLGILFVLSSQIGLDLLDDASDGALLWKSGNLIFLVLVVVIALFGLAGKVLAQNLINWIEKVLLVGTVVLYCVLIFFPPLNLMYGSYQHDLSAEGLFWALVFNLSLFLEMLGIIFIGYYRKETWLINLGAVALFLFILIKYFDWFFTFMDKSVFFIGAGVLLFVVGWFMEKGRRYMLETMKSEDPALRITN